jgi:hypothetical protein
MVAGPLEQLQLLERQHMALVSMEQRLAGSIWSTQLGTLRPVDPGHFQSRCTAIGPAGPLSLANRNGADHPMGPHGADPEDLAIFRPQRHLADDTTVILLPYGGGERVCLGKALAELEIRLLAVGLLQQLSLELEADQDLTLRVIPSPSPADGLLVRASSRAS